MLADKSQEFTGRDLLEHMLEAKNVVRMGMGIAGVGQLRHAQHVQQLFDLRPLEIRTVKEHGMLAITNNSRRAVINLGEVDFQQLGILREGKVVQGILDFVDHNAVRSSGAHRHQQQHRHQ